MHKEFLERSRELLPQAVALRRRIHAHPELGNALPRTREAVLEALDGLGLNVHLSNATSGIVAVLEGASPGPTVLLRGDMDALPMPEDTGLPFASKVEGCMHACGHDAHTAMLAVAAQVLGERRDRLQGTVSFMFQPGEEGPGGAKPMLEEGVLNAGGQPDAAFALHVYPNRSSGLLMTRPGPILAAADQAYVRLTGRGGHGSMPYDALDPVPVACELVQALQTFVTRRFNPFDPVVITVGCIRAGTVNNVIPEHAELEITIRSFNPDTRRRAHDGIERLSEHIASAHDLRAEVAITHGYPPTVNDEQMAAFVADTARELVGDAGFQVLSAPLPGAEDFSYVLDEIPGCFTFLGAAPPDVDPTDAAPCHSNRMLIDEQAMATGIAMHASVAWRYLNRP